MERTILIIDDDENDALIAQRVLSKIDPGIKAKVATSGEDGLSLLRGDHPLPGMILLDLKMRGMDGIEFLRRVRRDDSLSHIPVIIVTHSTLDADTKEAYEAGATSFLHKAFDVDQFGAELKKIMEKWMLKVD